MASTLAEVERWLCEGNLVGDEEVSSGMEAYETLANLMLKEAYAFALCSSFRWSATWVLPEFELQRGGAAHEQHQPVLHLWMFDRLPSRATV